MKEKKLDFLSRRLVRATVLISINGKENLISGRLPDGYLLDGGIFRFPAGFWESYFVNGKEYNTEGDRSLQEQKNLIIYDLLKEGFTKNEAEEFIESIKIKEGKPILLTLESSNKYLRYHSDFEKEALSLISRIRQEIHDEIKSEFKHNTLLKNKK